MTGSFGESGAHQLDASVREVVDAVRNAAQLLRSLAPLRSQWQALEMALSEFAQAATISGQPAEAFAPPAAPLASRSQGPAPALC